MNRNNVGDGVLDVPSAARRQFGAMRKNSPIEVEFFRGVVEDADPYGYDNSISFSKTFCKMFDIPIKMR